MKVKVTPTKTTRYAHPKGPALPQLALYANKPQEVDSVFISIIQKVDPDAQVDEVLIQAPEDTLTEIETSDPVVSLETLENTAPIEVQEPKTHKKSKKKKSKFLKG